MPACEEASSNVGTTKTALKRFHARCGSEGTWTAGRSLGCVVGYNSNEYIGQKYQTQLAASFEKLFKSARNDFGFFVSCIFFVWFSNIMLYCEVRLSITIGELGIEAN